MKEVDLFKPLKAYFEAMGYGVDGEVKGVDLLAGKESSQDMIVVELKLQLNLKALIQVARRQQKMDHIYLALPTQAYKPRQRAFKDKVFLLQRLGIGLLLVHVKTQQIKVVQHAIPLDMAQSRRLRKKQKESLVGEFKQRIAKANAGGINQGKIITAYREEASYLLWMMVEYGLETPKSLREHGGGKKTTRILYENHYQWFQRVDRGRYKVSPQGQAYYEKEKDLILKIVKGKDQMNGIHRCQ